MFRQAWRRIESRSLPDRLLFPEFIAVHRVVSKRRDHKGKWIVEFGPWHPSIDEARKWAAVLMEMGYIVRIENMRGELTDMN